MKKLFVIIALILSIKGFAQKIKISEYDKFLKEYRIETSKENMKSGLNNGYAFKIRSVGNTIFLNMGSYGETSGVIGADSQLMFLLDNDSSVAITSKGIQSYEISTYQSLTQKISNHEYHISIDDLMQLNTRTVKSMRKYLSDGYIDNDFKREWSVLLNRLCGVFIAEYNSKVLTAK